MNITDLSLFFSNRCSEFEILLDEIGDFKPGDFVNIISDNVVLVRRIQDGANGYVMGKFATRKYKNDFEEKSHGKICCQITGITGDFLEISMLYDLRVKYDQEINDDGIVIAALDRALKDTSIMELNTALQSEYLLKLNDADYYLIGKFDSSEENNAFILVDPIHRKYFAVSSKKFAEIDPEDGNGTESSYVIDAPARPLNHIEKYSFYLFGGPVRFEDKSKLHRLSEVTKAFISNGGNEYVNRWRYYAEKQMELEQQKHDQAGYLHFASASVERVGYYRFYVKNANLIQNFLKNARKKDGKIQVKIKQFSHYKYKEYKAVMTDKIFPGMDYVECSFEDKDKEADFNPTLSGTIEVDLSGSEVVYERRIQAFDLIQKGVSANSALLYILDGRTVNTYSKKELNDSINLDEGIIKRYFKYSPNPSQRRAIEIALHTPDIAVIQGPPGTGKTKVIQAIHAHLQAKQKNSAATSDKYLLTAYQRDATQNMADGVDQKFDLPVISYLGKSSSTSVDPSLKQWCDEKIKYITEANKNIEFYSTKKSDIVFVNEVRDIICDKCSIATAQSLLLQVVDKARSFIDRGEIFSLEEHKTEQKEINDAIGKVECIQRKLERRVSVEKMPELLFYAKAIPTSEQEMSDKGSELVLEIVDKLNCMSFEDEFVGLIDDLKLAASKSDFKMLCSVKTALILKINGVRDLYEGEKEEIAKVLKPLAEAMKTYRLNEKQEIISEYLYSLFPGTELQETVKKYQQIIAATHQLASEQKKYKDVLIDEAARSCPADLMIPLSKTENRIILVGDHKQLPQYIEDDVLKTIYQLTSDPNALFAGLDEKAIKEKYECSMFEYLIDKADALSKRDPSHERVIQLNVQYRMPPVIGSIVSKNFYDGLLNNPNPPLPPEHYRQQLPGIANKNLVWIDLSKLGTTEKRSASGSRYRLCEVETIAKYIKCFAESGGWNTNDTSKENRIGVITFYSKQRELIRKKLDSELGAELAEMIEVGTVDSFQGKEFGIVFLSLVRNNDMDDVGFLSSSNRMCVALSRAIKCLVVVGSSRILKYANAKEKIPALFDVYKACKNKEDGVCELLTE